MPSGRNLPILISLAAALALALGGCGASSGGRHPDYANALAGAPPPLAALYEEGNELLPGGEKAFEGRIATLKGFPVLVNVWASWCGPCRFEFPFLQKLSARYGKRVAFLGVDSQDSEGFARGFLEDTPVPYPSYSDPDQQIARAIGTGGGYPDTAFYDRRGDLCFLRRGPYVSEQELAADIRDYALRENCEGG
ncbi:MAG TPA: TlpA disulfide reductase family protein [Solirubrobacterales bacterium]|nr:TlpA disulfide reductase family protein [Solirubrobacterales bacterium]